MMRRHTAVRGFVLRLCEVPRASTLKLAGGFSGATEPDFVFRLSPQEWSTERSSRESMSILKNE